MKIISLTPGAGGSICGSCLNDNTMAAAMRSEGHDVVLVPLYTPITTDEENMSSAPLFFGGINVYLQQHLSLFRHLPRFLDRVLDSPRLVSSLARLPASHNVDQLADLTLSMVRGEQGHQRKEVQRLVRWMRQDPRPDIIHFSNLLIAGSVREIKRVLSIPVVVTLQGDDVFLDSISEPVRSEIVQEMRQLAREVDHFIVHSQFYGEKMTKYFNIPSDRITQVPLGIDVTDYLPTHHATALPSSVRRIGYLARICPAKGLHLLVDAFIELKQQKNFSDVTLCVAGDLGKADRPYFLAQKQKLDAAKCGSDFLYAGRLNRKEKINFLHRLDLFTVPAPYEEPKGRYVLEALASGIPVVQPDHGVFPELLSRVGGGQLFAAGDKHALSEALVDLLMHPEKRARLAKEGPEGVKTNACARHTAQATIDTYRQVLAS
tara:strand:+ start:6285 stop:7583 length:1299 start_codon:yes stop_codon:yes gene_type:complete